MGKQVKLEPEDQKFKRSFIERTTKTRVKKEHLAEDHNQAVAGVQPKQELGAPKKPKHNRIIIRNLVVDINEKHLRKLCQPFGQITSISVPKHGVKNCGRGFAFVEFSKKNMCMKAIRTLNQMNYKGRTIIVDLAVSKDVFQKTQGTDEVAQEPAIKEEPIASSEMKIQEPIETKTDRAARENKDSSAKDADEKPKEDQDLSKTIFVRNLPFGVEEDQLYRFFRKFGKIHFVKLVIDKQTEEPKGTAFIRFRQSEPAERLIKHSREYEQSLNIKATRKFQIDPNINLEIEGRMIKIFPAQSRTSLNERIQGRDKSKDDSLVKKVKPLKKIKDLSQLVEMDKHHKRNLQLAEEGICRPEEWMLRADKEKFENGYREKVEKLKNPNNFVSATRIIVKYLDRTVTEEALKEICHSFIRQAYANKHKLLTFCKLMLDQQREKSIGIAFIEFAKPEMSLNFVRWVKQNRKTLFTQKNSILIEFVIQDARKIAVLKKKIKKVK